MKDKQTKASASVDKYTRQGSDELQKGSLEQAAESFETAYRRCQHVDDSFVTRVCAFNLGAVYIACRQPDKGLQMLQNAIPPANTKDGRSNGDLFYNFGLAYELQSNSTEAVKYFELALEEYQTERDNIQMVAEVSMKLGILYSALGSRLQSARCHATAAACYHKIQDFGHQTTCLYQQGTALVLARKVDDALEVSDNCMIMCQRVKDTATLGRVYNELGLIYTQCRDFPKAATCFELALPLSRGPGNDKKRQAVILQNLGAVYNSLGDFQRSLNLHESAANLHVELGNRGAQGQCFTNLAYANSQLGDNEAAGECYLHALQAAKDTGDLHAQWQAAEGLGAVSFHQGNVDKAVKYYKQALSTLAISREKNPVAQERIVAKLTDALEFQVSGQKKPPPGPRQSRNGSVVPGSVDILVNSQPRPPTRQERREMAIAAKMREESKKYNRSKIQSEFEKIALGIGEYESDSDHSLSRDRNRRRPARRSSSLRSRPRSAHDSVDLHRSRSETRREARPTASEGDDARPGMSRRASSRRSIQHPGSSQYGRNVGRRQGMQPLLREESYDSEEEWKKDMKKGRSKSYSTADSDCEIFQDISDQSSAIMKRLSSHLPQFMTSDDELHYRERLHPPSTPEVDAPEENGRRPSRKSRKTRKTLQEIPISPSKAVDSESDTAPEDPEVVIQAQVAAETASAPHHKPGRKRPTTAKHGRNHTSMDHTLINQDLYREHLEQMMTTESGSEAPSGGGEQEGGTAEEEESECEDSVTEGDTEAEDQEKQADMLPSTMPAKSPPSPRGPPPARPMLNTYEVPVPVSPGGDAAPGEQEHGAQDLPYRPGTNYFRMESKPSIEVPVDDAPSEGMMPPGPSKVSMPDPEDPLYQTIRSMRGGTSTGPPPVVRVNDDESEDEPPEPPPMRAYSQHQPSEFEQLSIAEQEKMLYQYQKKRDENNREQLGRGEDEENELALPRKGKKGKQTSKTMCVVM